MSRKFVTSREVAFINSINRELVQHVVGQEIYYYAISKPETRVHRLYNEAIVKTWSPPVKINALVRWEDNPTKATLLGLDSSPGCEVFFHTQELEERNVVPTEGDFVEFGEVYFEITSFMQPEIVFGQINNKIMTQCKCVPSRQGQFQMGSQSDESDDRSHQVNNSEPDER
jgi:hypothetical protein